MTTDQGIVSDGTTTATRAASMAPGSTPSTWAGVIVLASVAGLALLRRSLRRMQ